MTATLSAVTRRSPLMPSEPRCTARTSAVCESYGALTSQSPPWLTSIARVQVASVQQRASELLYDGALAAGASVHTVVIGVVVMLAPPQPASASTKTWA